MEKPVEIKVWWKPALEVFSRVSGWIITPILLALIIGKNLDKHFDTKPWIFIGLSVISFAISSIGIVKTITEYNKQLDKEKNDKGINTN